MWQDAVCCCGVKMHSLMSCRCNHTSPVTFLLKAATQGLGIINCIEITRKDLKLFEMSICEYKIRVKLHCGTIQCFCMLMFDTFRILDVCSTNLTKKNSDTSLCIPDHLAYWWIKFVLILINFSQPLVNRKGLKSSFLKMTFLCNFISVCVMENFKRGLSSQNHLMAYYDDIDWYSCVFLMAASVFSWKETNSLI